MEPDEENNHSHNYNYHPREEKLQELEQKPCPPKQQPVLAPQGCLKCSVREDGEWNQRQQPANHNIKSAMKRRRFYGRRQELDCLRSIYEGRLFSAVLVGGVSGTGKSALVKQFVETMVASVSDYREKKEVGSSEKEEAGTLSSISTPASGPLVLQGKYEELHDPFSALSQAFDQYFQSQIDQYNREGYNHHNTKDLRDSLRKSIGNEGNVLWDIFPALQSFLFASEPTTSSASDSVNSATKDAHSSTNNLSVNTSNNHDKKPTTSKEHQLNQLCFHFLKFLQALTKQRPLILVLDNLQWADTASLELIAFVLKSSNLTNFFLLGTFRLDGPLTQVQQPTAGQQQQQHQPFTSWKEEIIQQKEIRLQILHLENHNQQEIGIYIAQELYCPPADCQGITETIYEKTNGNIFFTMQMLSELKRCGTISYSDTTDTWTWNADEVRRAVSDSNGMDAIIKKIESLPPSLQTALQLAAYLRSHFDLETLRQLLKKRGHSLSVTELTKLLDVAVMAGLLHNVVGSKHYQFAHDGIQEAAYQMVPEGKERDELQLLLGQFLYALDTHDWMMFVAAHHWIAVSHLVPPLELARLLEKAGAKAVSMAAFEQAAYLYTESIAALEKVEDHWALHYNLTLNLHRSAAEIELCTGRFERGYKLGNIVLENARCLLDRMPTQFAIEVALAREDRNEEALALDLKLLEELGEVPRTLAAVKEMFQVKRLIQNRSDVDVLMLLPQMTDPYKLAAMKCLSNVAVRAYCCGKNSLMVRSIIKQVKLIFRYGLCAQASVAFAQYGYIIGALLRDHTCGRRMGRLARDIIEMNQDESSGGKEEECKALYTLASFVESWSVPIPDIIETFEQSHNVGMESGTLDFAMASAFQATVFLYLSGRPLAAVADMLESVSEQMIHYKMEFSHKLVLNMQWLVYHLSGRPGDKSIDWKIAGTLDEDHSNTTNLSWNYFVRMQLAYFMEDLELADRMARKFHSIATSKSYTFVSAGLFFSCLIANGLAQKTGRRKHRARALKAAKKMRKLIDARGLNSLQRCLLMEAECQPAKKQSAAKQKYDKAIALAAENRCLQDEALANELAGEFFLSRKEFFWARHYFTQAWGLYSEWGAQAKVSLLLRKRGSYICKNEYSGSMASFTCPLAKETCGLIMSESNITIEFEHEVDDDEDACSVLTDIRETYPSQDVQVQ